MEEVKGVAFLMQYIELDYIFNVMLYLVCIFFDTRADFYFLDFSFILLDSF